MLTPNLGDGVQMIKAGILEIADIFVVNKADLDGHARAITELRAMLSLAPRGRDTSWRSPIIPTVAAKQEGIEQLWEAVLEHRAPPRIERAGPRADRATAQDETAEVAAELARDRVRRALSEDAALSRRLLQEGHAVRYCGGDP